MDLGQFSPREKAVIELFLQGKSNKQMAFILHLTPRTIEYHLTNIYNKLGVNSRSEAILLLAKPASISPDQQKNTELRESTVESSSVVHHNEDVRMTTGRQQMEARKYVFGGIGLLIFISIVYLLFNNWITDMHRSVINTVNPENSMLLTPSPINTLQESLSDEQLGLHTLVNFLDDLNHANYNNAAQLFGGSFETMTAHNPDIDPKDHAALLRNACTINGMQCLKIYSAGPASAGPYRTSEIENRTEFKFQVEFSKNDGSLFELGPCCGGNATDSPPQTIFYFTLVKVSKNQFLV